MKNCLIAIVGATATGKTELALRLAQKIDAEIISCDSRQIYSELDIATAKPLIDEQQGIKHHLLGIISPTQTFSVSDFNTLAQQTIKDIQSRNKNVIIAGGTGFYFRILLEGLTLTNVKPDLKLREELNQLAKEKGNLAVFEILKGLDNQACLKIHPNNLDKVIRAIEISKSLEQPMSNTGVNFEPKYNVLWLGLDFKDRQKLYERINLRVDKMLESGLEKEAKTLFEKYGELPILLNTIGYQEFLPYFKGEIDYKSCVEKIKQNSRKYAKRQLTWFKANKKINWFYKDEQDIEQILNKCKLLDDFKFSLS